jgi:hypothetical protein
MHEAAFSVPKLRQRGVLWPVSKRCLFSLPNRICGFHGGFTHQDEATTVSRIDTRRPLVSPTAATVCVPTGSFAGMIADAANDPSAPAVGKAIRTPSIVITTFSEAWKALPSMVTA